jgi:hypothetical protein
VAAVSLYSAAMSKLVVASLVASLVLVVACGRGRTPASDDCTRMRDHGCDLLTEHVDDRDAARNDCRHDEATVADCLANASAEMVSCALAATTLDAYLTCVGKSGNVDLAADIDKVDLNGTKTP